MKFLIYFLFTFSIIAQDSTFVENLVCESSQILGNNVIILEDVKIPKSLVELKINRSWKRNVYANNDNLINKSAIIKYKKREPNFIDTDLFLILVGSAVALGATSAYFKLESDKYYDKYLMTNDKQQLNKVDDYDLYSGLALGALEINFGFLIYKFLTD